MADAEIIPFPQPGKEWDGDSAQSRRWVEKQGVADMREQPEYDAMWVAHLDLPPLQKGELWHQWAQRTAKERGVGSTALKLTEDQQETR